MKNIAKYADIIIYLGSMVLISFICSSAYAYETLRHAYLITLNSNPELCESKAAREAAWEAYMQLRGGLFPTVALVYNVGRGKGQSFSPQTLNIGYTTNNVQHKMITVTQLLFDGGALTNRVAGAESIYEASNQQTILTMNQVALRVASAYLGVLRAKEAEIIAHQNLRMHEGKLNEQNQRFRGGAGTIADVNLTKIKLKEAQLALNQISLDLSNAKATYKQVVGRYPPNELILPNDPDESVPKSLEESRFIADVNNPAIHAEEFSTISAHHGIYAAEAVLYWPNITIQLNAFRDNNINAIPARNTTMQGFIAMNYNIFNGGADLAGVHKAVQQFYASRDHLETKRREIALAVEQTWNELESAKQDTKILKIQIVQNQELVSDFYKEWQINRRSLLDLMQIENDLFLSRLALINAKYKVKIDKYTILASTGMLSNYLLREQCDA